MADEEKKVVRPLIDLSNLTEDNKNNLIIGSVFISLFIAICVIISTFASCDINTNKTYLSAGCAPHYTSSGTTNGWECPKADKPVIEQK
jgi:hypothetical protein